MAFRKDELGTDDGYDPRRRYVRGCDNRGQRLPLPRAHMAPEVSGWIASVVESRRIPEYRTGQDLIRDAIYHHMHKLEAEGVIEDPVLSAQAQLALALARAERLDDEIRHRNEIVDGLTQALKSVRKNGNEEDIRETVYQARLAADLLPDPWKGRLEKAIKGR